MTEATPVVVVGLGPAGVIVSRVLAGAGIPVLALQPQPEPAHRSPTASPPPTVRRSPAETAAPARAPHQGADRLGGSKHLAAPQSYRLDPGAFDSWPLSIDELDGYYRRVERAFRVAPRPETAWTARMHAAALSIGHAPFAAPAAASGDTSALLRHPGITVVDATVTRVIRDSSGAVTGVESIDASGQRHRTACRTVVVAGGVIAGIRLLLLSGITGGGLVGSGLMSHNAFTVNGLFPGVDLGRDRAGAASAVAISEFEGDRFDHAGLGFTGGSVLQAAMTGPRTAAWREACATGLPSATAGDDPVAWIRRHESSIGTVWAQPDQLARPENRVDLDPTHRDVAGDPVARVTFDLADDDRLRWRFLADRMRRWLEAAGAGTTWAAPIEPQPLGTHLYGGVPMGADPATSVVDSFGRAHDTPGLVVVGSSTFPSTGGRGPVETIEALAWRTAERLARDARRAAPSARSR